MPQYPFSFPQHPQYPAQAPQQPYTYTPGSIYPQYPPPQPEKSKKSIITIIIVVVIIIVIIPLIGWYLLFTWVSGLEGSGTISVSIAGSVTDKMNSWKIEIIRVRSGTLSLEDAKFEIVDENGLLIFKRRISNANPASIVNVGETIYPMPSELSPVKDSNTNETVTGDTAITTYEYCCFAYVDANNDHKVSVGDSIWVYKDYDADGKNDIFPKYSFNILDYDDNLVMKKEF
jgi:hypothetical protein